MHGTLFIRRSSYLCCVRGGEGFFVPGGGVAVRGKRRQRDPLGVIKHPSLTPPILNGSTPYRADRRRNPAPIHIEKHEKPNGHSHAPCD